MVLKSFLTLLVFGASFLVFAQDQSNQQLVDPVLGFKSLPNVSEMPNGIIEGAESAPVGNFSQAENQKKTTLDRNNLVSLWLRLAATGRSQAEIEGVLKNSGSILSNQTKALLRDMVLTQIQLRLERISGTILEDADRKDVRFFIRNLVKNYSLENDSILSQTLDEKFLPYL